MSISGFFSYLRAPLKNIRWSWGSVRRDGVVFLRVWQDRACKHNGAEYMQITNNAKYAEDPSNFGWVERLEHIRLLQQGARCYLIMCEVEDPDAVPRTIKDFNESEVFVGGSLVELNGDWWIERGLREKAAKVRLSS